MQRNWDLIKQVILIIEKSDKNEPLRKQEFEKISRRILVTSVVS